MRHLVADVLLTSHCCSEGRFLERGIENERRERERGRKEKNNVKRKYKRIITHPPPPVCAPRQRNRDRFSSGDSRRLLARIGNFFVRAIFRENACDPIKWASTFIIVSRLIHRRERISNQYSDDCRLISSRFLSPLTRHDIFKR